MSNKSIPLDKVQSVISQINLTPILEVLLNDFSKWSSENQRDQEEEFSEYLSNNGDDEMFLFEFLLLNDIGIRPTGFEFYRIDRSEIDDAISYFQNIKEGKKV